MRLRRTSRRHKAGVNSEDFYEFGTGDRVYTTDGLFGRVTAVEDGHEAGAEQYIVELDYEMGGGIYTASELRRPTSDDVEKTAAPDGQVISEKNKVTLHLEAADLAEDEDIYSLATDDYPELAEILAERPPMAHSEHVSSKTGAYVVLDEAGLLVAGPFTSRQDAENAEKMAREDGQMSIHIERTSSSTDHLGNIEALTKEGMGFFLDKFLYPMAERMIEAQPEDIRFDPHTSSNDLNGPTNTRPRHNHIPTEQPSEIPAHA